MKPETPFAVLVKNEYEFNKIKNMILSMGDWCSFQWSTSDDPKHKTVLGMHSGPFRSNQDWYTGPVTIELFDEFCEKWNIDLTEPKPMSSITETSEFKERENYWFPVDHVSNYEKKVFYGRGAEDAQGILTESHDKEMEDFEYWKLKTVDHCDIDKKTFILIDSEKKVSFQELLQLFRNRNK